MSQRTEVTEKLAADVRDYKAAYPDATITAIAKAFGKERSHISRILSGARRAGDPNRLPFHKLAPPAYNPRRIMPADGFAGLCASIAQHGVIVPLVVARLETQTGGSTHQVVAGERRYRAVHKLIKKGTLKRDFQIPVHVVDPGDEGEALLIALAENLAREDMHPLDEGQAFVDLAARGDYKTGTDEIARAVGRTRRHVQKRMELVKKLDDETRDALIAGEIKLAHAEALCEVGKAQQHNYVRLIESGAIRTEAELREAIRPGRTDDPPDDPSADPSDVASAKAETSAKVEEHGGEQSDIGDRHAEEGPKITADELFAHKFFNKRFCVISIVHQGDELLKFLVLNRQTGERSTYVREDQT